MKHHRLHIIPLLVLAVLLTGCGKVTETEEAIAAIGTVTVDSEAAIIYAEQLYASLSENQQARVEGADLLTAARTEYDRQQDLITQTETAIASIGTVTVDSGKQIQQARELYRALIGEKLETQVSHLLPILEEAETTYELVQIQAVYDDAADIYEMNNYEKAIELFDAFIEQYPDSPLVKDAKRNAADCHTKLLANYLTESNLEEALQRIEMIPKQYGSNSVSAEYTQLKTRISDMLAEIRPETGEFFLDELDSGYGEFTISNESDHDVCLKLIDNEDSEKAVLFYVRAKESHTFNLEDGEYILRYSSGEHWFGDEAMFGENSYYAQSAGLCEIETQYLSSSVQYSVVTYTISPASGQGNTRTSEIDPEDF
ncbi:MAG: hypothetical protein IJB35_04855 [Oscillospiraceae bacterium]|nr:hypothetical protein [Oscillospiraceae bacterium]